MVLPNPSRLWPTTNEGFWGVKLEIAQLGLNGTAAARLALLACINDEHPKAGHHRGCLGTFAFHPDVIEALPIVNNGDESIQVEGSAIRALGRRAPSVVELAWKSPSAQVGVSAFMPGTDRHFAYADVLP